METKDVFNQTIIKRESNGNELGRITIIDWPKNTDDAIKMWDNLDGNQKRFMAVQAFGKARVSIQANMASKESMLRGVTNAKLTDVINTLMTTTRATNYKKAIENAEMEIKGLDVVIKSLEPLKAMEQIKPEYDKAVASKKEWTAKLENFKKLQAEKEARRKVKK